jgi:hypothetical protein
MVWTVALSATITLLTLAPMVLPSEAPLARLPGPLAGMVEVGRVVASQLEPAADKPPAPQPASGSPTPAPSPSESPPAAAPPQVGSGVLGDETGGSLTEGEKPVTPRQKTTPSLGRHAPNAGRDDDEGQAREAREARKAERKAEQAEQQADHRVEKAAEHAAKKAEQAEKKAEKSKHKGGKAHKNG